MPQPTVAIEQPDGIWIIDSSGETVFANEAMARILGSTVAELGGSNSFKFVFEEDRLAAQRLFASREAASSAPFHFKLRRKSGEPIWVDVQGTPTYNAAGKFTGIVGTFTVSASQAA